MERLAFGGAWSISLTRGLLGIDDRVFDPLIPPVCEKVSPPFSTTCRLESTALYPPVI